VKSGGIAGLRIFLVLVMCSLSTISYGQNPGARADSEDKDFTGIGGLAGPWGLVGHCPDGISAPCRALSRGLPMYFCTLPHAFPPENSLYYRQLRWDGYRVKWAKRDGWIRSLPMPREGFNYGHNANGRSPIIITHEGDPRWRDYSVQFEVEILGPDPSWNPYGLPSSFRRANLMIRVAEFSESWNEPAMTRYALRFETKTSPGWSTQGNWLFIRNHDYYIPGTGYGPAEGCGEVLASGHSAAILDGINHVRVDCIGDRIRIRFNGTEILDLIDTVPGCSAEGYGPILSGGFGLLYSFECMGQFRDFRFRPLRQNRRPGFPRRP
jgi:hypothetical protein